MITTRPATDDLYEKVFVLHEQLFRSHIEKI